MRGPSTVLPSVSLGRIIVSRKGKHGPAHESLVCVGKRSTWAKRALNVGALACPLCCAVPSVCDTVLARSVSNSV